MSKLNWIVHVSRMDNTRKVSQVFNNNPQGNRLRGCQKNTWCSCVQTDVNKCKITNWKDRLKERELTGGSPLRNRRSTLDCSVIKEEGRWQLVDMLAQRSISAMDKAFTILGTVDRHWWQTPATWYHILEDCTLPYSADRNSYFEWKQRHCDIKCKQSHTVYVFYGTL